MPVGQPVEEVDECLAHGFLFFLNDRFALFGCHVGRGTAQQHDLRLQHARVVLLNAMQRQDVRVGFVYVARNDRRYPDLREHGMAEGQTLVETVRIEVAEAEGAGDVLPFLPDRRGVLHGLAIDPWVGNPAGNLGQQQDRFHFLEILGVQELLLQSDEGAEFHSSEKQRIDVLGGGQQHGNLGLDDRSKAGERDGVAGGIEVFNFH